MNSLGEIDWTPTNQWRSEQYANIACSEHGLRTVEFNHRLLLTNKSSINFDHVCRRLPVPSAYMQFCICDSLNHQLSTHSISGALPAVAGCCDDAWDATSRSRMRRRAYGLRASVVGRCGGSRWAATAARERNSDNWAHARLQTCDALQRAPSEVIQVLYGHWRNSKCSKC